MYICQFIIESLKERVFYYLSIYFRGIHEKILESLTITCFK